jgi:hypothetical protein
MSLKPRWRRTVFSDSGTVVTGLCGCERIGASPRRPASRIARQCAGDSPASLYAACWLLAKVHLACDLPATATKDADLHHSACGYLRAGDSTVHRLPLRPARWLDAFNLEEANESGGAKQARGQPARVDDCASHRAELPWASTCSLTPEASRE